MSEVHNPTGNPIERPTIGLMWASYDSLEVPGSLVTASRWIALHLIAGEEPKTLYWAWSGHAPLVADTEEGPRFVRSETAVSPDRKKGQLVDRQIRKGIPIQSTNVFGKITDEANFLKVAAGRLSPILLNRRLPDDIIMTRADAISEGDLLLTPADLMFTAEPGHHDNLNGITPLELVEDLRDAKLWQRLNPRTRARHAKVESLIASARSANHSTKGIGRRQRGDPRVKEIKDAINQVTRQKRMIRVAAAGLFMAGLTSLTANLLHWGHENLPVYAIEQTQNSEGTPTAQQQTLQAENGQAITHISFMESAEQIPLDLTELGVGAGSIFALLTYVWVGGETKRRWAPREAERWIIKIQSSAAKPRS